MFSCIVLFLGLNGLSAKLTQNIWVIFCPGSKIYCSYIFSKRIFIFHPWHQMVWKPPATSQWGTFESLYLKKIRLHITDNNSSMCEEVIGCIWGNFSWPTFQVNNQHYKKGFKLQNTYIKIHLQNSSAWSLFLQTLLQKKSWLWSLWHTFSVHTAIPHGQIASIYPNQFSSSWQLALAFYPSYHSM